MCYVIHRNTTVSALSSGDSHAAGENNETLRASGVGKDGKKENSVSCLRLW